MRSLHQRRKLPFAITALLTLVFAASGCGQEAGSPGSSKIPQRNGEILFQNGRGRLDLMRPYGSQQQVVPRSPRDVTSASFSPDGKWIAFVRELGGSCPVRLYVMRADGTDRRPLTPMVNDRVMEAPCFGGPAWSPDGKRIAFTKDDALGSAIWVRNVDRGPPRELSDVPSQSNGRDDRDPAWSPDGKTIAFDRGYPATLWLMDADGGNQHQLTTAPPPLCKGAQRPDWSPDGQLIAFGRTCSLSLGRNKANTWGDIYTIRPDGSDPRRLTDGRRQSAFNDSPAWSPDGKRIVFDSVVSRSSGEKIDVAGVSHEEFDDIYVISAGGRGQKRLIRLLTYTLVLDWGARR